MDYLTIGRPSSQEYAQDKRVGGKGGYGQMLTRTRTQNTLVHLHNTYFSYLSLFFLQQYSLPNPGVNLLSFYRCRGEG